MLWELTAISRKWSFLIVSDRFWPLGYCRFLSLLLWMRVFCQLQVELSVVLPNWSNVSGASSMVMYPIPRMKPSTKDMYWPDGPGSLTGGSGATELIVWRNFWSRCSIWPMPELDLFGLAHAWIASVLSGPYHVVGGLFCVTHTTIEYVRSYPYSVFSLFGLAHTQSSTCLVWLILKIRSVPCLFSGAIRKKISLLISLER